MWEEICFRDDDRIAIIAPHPDDECLGASAALLLAPERTDVYVISDGSHGNSAVPFEEEAAIRKQQFEAEMRYVKPHAHYWLGYEDTKLPDFPDAVSGIDFARYTKVFLPWTESDHSDHRAAAQMCIAQIRLQKAKAECFSYEITAPFRMPTHYIDITAIAEQKRTLVRFHADQGPHERITLSLNAFRAAQQRVEGIEYVEAYLKV